MIKNTSSERIAILMNKKKKIILFAVIAACAVVVGIAAALIFSSLGTGDSFRRAGSCKCSGASDRKADVTTEPDPESENIIYRTPAPDETPAEQTAVPTDHTDEPTEEPTEPPVDPYEELMEKADTSMMKDIVNILLIGVDYSPERETWRNKDFHSDVMMVMAVNFDENRVDLISLPRDTYAEIPGVKGIYKLNASLNCGGGLYKSDGSVNPKGLEKVCEAAEWMLGGIDVDYYYAVTMTSLKELVDLFGGFEYDMDIKFHIQGRSYEKGMQHINGQAFLDYCRVRKSENGLSSSETTDARRVDRQKRMLVAFFKQMKADQLVTKAPDLINTFDGELYTNCTFAQTAALAAFAYNLDPNNIGMYSMGGSQHSLFQWNFTFTDQANRVDIIKKVYNVSVKKHGQYALSYARYRWCDMLYQHYTGLLTPLTQYVQKLIDEDDLLPAETPEPSLEPSVQPSATAPSTTAPATTPPDVTPTPDSDPTTPPPTDPPTAPPTKEPDPTETPGDDTGSSGAVTIAVRGVHHQTAGETRKYTEEQRELFEQYKEAVKELDKIHKEADKEAKKYRNSNSNSLSTVGQTYLKQLDTVQELAIQVAKTFGYNKVKNFTQPYGPTGTYGSSSAWAINYFNNKKFNEVIVDFN